MQDVDLCVTDFERTPLTGGHTVEASSTAATRLSLTLIMPSSLSDMARRTDRSTGW